MIPKPAATNVIDEVLSAHAQTVAKSLTDRDVLEALKQQGISSLEDLVQKSLASFQAGSVGGVVARDTFIYTQAVYKTAMPIDQNLINELSKKISR
jgi:hypothetical protein